MRNYEERILDLEERVALHNDQIDAANRCLDALTSRNTALSQGHTALEIELAEVKERLGFQTGHAVPEKERFARQSWGTSWDLGTCAHVNTCPDYLTAEEHQAIVAGILKTVDELKKANEILREALVAAQNREVAVRSALEK